MNKKELRKKFLSIRNNIDNRKEKSLKIIDKIIKDPKYQSSSIIGLYNAINSEVDLSDLITYSLNKGYIVVFPKVIDNYNIKFYRINSIKDFKIGKYNILELQTNEEYSNIDLLIVPGLCFDKKRYRVGYGKGYYDRFLENKNIYTIGVCYEEQITLTEIPHTIEDIPLNKIITEEKEY